MPICLSVCLSICLSVRLSVCMLQLVAKAKYCNAHLILHNFTIHTSFTQQFRLFPSKFQLRIVSNVCECAEYQIFVSSFKSTTHQLATFIGSFSLFMATCVSRLTTDSQLVRESVRSQQRERELDQYHQQYQQVQRLNNNYMGRDSSTPTK